MTIRRKHDAIFKAKVAIDAIKNDMTISEICNKHSIGPTQVKNWKSELLDQAATVFAKEGKASAVNDNSQLLAILERKIGQLTIENDFLKKNLLKFPGKID
jgi:transposase-like protein